MSENQESKMDPIAKWMERDLTQSVLAASPAYEVDWSVGQLTEVVDSGRNPIVTGDSGVGKTAVLEEWIRRQLAGENAGALSGFRVIQFSIQRIAASQRKDASVGDAFNELIDALLDSNVVPYIRDIHLAYEHDLESHLQALAFRMDRPILGEADRRELAALMECSPGLEQHFVSIFVEEPDLQAMERLLDAWARDREASEGVRFGDYALRDALYLCHRFMMTERMPRKVLLFLEQLCGLCPEGGKVGSQMVIDRFCNRYKIPRRLIDPEEALDIEETRTFFGRELLGQEDAVHAVVRIIAAIKSGLSDMRRPFGVFLFVGPTGVGKTHLAQLLAAYLFGSRDRLIRFNMADYQDSPGPYVLFGHPGSHSRSARRGTLTTTLQGHPFSVILLDEFEKANASVHDRFFQLMDEGSFINAMGETVSCRSSIVIATSNAGAEHYRLNPLGFPTAPGEAGMNEAVQHALHEVFRFELLNRFDHVVHFRPLSRETIRTIARRELEHLQQRPGLLHRHVRLEIDDAVLDWLTAHGYDPHYGARFLRRCIEKHVVTSLADAIVREKVAAGDTLELTVHRDRIRTKRATRVVTPIAASPAPIRSPIPAEAWSENEFRERAETLLTEAEPLLAALTTDTDAYEHQLSEMNAPGFWEDATRRDAVLEGFRALDVRIQIQRRFARTILRLKYLMDGAPSRPIGKQTMARVYERAHESLGEWRTRRQQEHVAAAWLVISSADPLSANSSWVVDLAGMERGWCALAGLEASVVAVDAGDVELPSRVVLEVEGPGLNDLLQREVGIHRRIQSKARDERVRIELIPRGNGTRDGAESPRPFRRADPIFGLQFAWRMRRAIPERGYVLDLAGETEAVLREILADYAGYLLHATRQTVRTIRRYAEDGIGARDPQTGVVMPRLKEVMSGDLRRFYDVTP